MTLLHLCTLSPVASREVPLSRRWSRLRPQPRTGCGFYFLVFRSHTVMLSTYSWLCIQGVPSGGLEGPDGMPEIQPGLALCKVNTPCALKHSCSISPWAAGTGQRPMVGTPKHVRKDPGSPSAGCAQERTGRQSRARMTSLSTPQAPGRTDEKNHAHTPSA